MNIEIYKTPAAKELETESSKLIIKRPKSIYWVCVWFFIIVGNTIENIASKVLAFVLKNEITLFAAVLMITYGTLVIVITGIINMRRAYLVTAGILFIIVSLLSLIPVFIGHSYGNLNTTIHLLLFATAALSLLCSWFCLRPSFLKRADEFVAQKKSLKISPSA